MNTLIDLLLDIELLDSTSARTAVAAHHNWAYGDAGVIFHDGLPVFRAEVN
jgi:hypothetical protein